MLLVTIPAQIWIDRWGRRKPLIFGGTAMAICFIVTGGLYARFGVKRDGGIFLQSKAAQWVVTILTYLFVANFSWSWAVVSYSLSCLWISFQLTCSPGRQNLCMRNHSYQNPSSSLRSRASRQLVDQLCCGTDGSYISAIVCKWSILLVRFRNVDCSGSLRRYAGDQGKESGRDRKRLREDPYHTKKP